MEIKSLDLNILYQQMTLEDANWLRKSVAKYGEDETARILLRDYEYSTTEYINGRPVMGFATYRDIVGIIKRKVNAFLAAHASDLDEIADCGLAMIATYFAEQLGPELNISSSVLAIPIALIFHKAFFHFIDQLNQEDKDKTRNQADK